MAGKWFVQDSEPVAAGLFDIWVKTNQEARIKTPAGWTLWGNFGSPDFGHIPKKGGIATGSIDGAHGHAAAHNTKMDGDATLNGDSMVTLSMLEDQIKSIRELIVGTGGSSSRSAGTIPGTTTGGETGYEYAFAMDVKFCVNDQWTEFRMPEFRGDVSATSAQCHLFAGSGPSWGFALVGWAHGQDESYLYDPYKNSNGLRGWGMNLNYPSAVVLERSTDSFKVKLHNYTSTGATTGAMVLGFCVARR